MTRAETTMPRLVNDASIARGCGNPRESGSHGCCCPCRSHSGGDVGADVDACNVHGVNHCFRSSTWKKTCWDWSDSTMVERPRDDSGGTRRTRDVPFRCFKRRGVNLCRVTWPFVEWTPTARFAAATSKLRAIRAELWDRMFCVINRSMKRFVRCEMLSDMIIEYVIQSLVGVYSMLLLITRLVGNER